MADEPTKQVELSDGRRIDIRRISPGDKPALLSGFERMSAESRYRRFFSPMQKLSDTDLAYLTEVDHHDHEAVIAFESGTGTALGVARYVRLEDPRLAEVAVTVVDDWQGRGVAKAMLRNLTRRAREEGIDTFSALVLSENEAALELFKAMAANDVAPRRRPGGQVELLIELPDEDDISGSLLGRALRTAASGEVEINPWRVLKRRFIDNRPER